MAIDDSEATFRVVVNAEGQHSIWFSHRALPAGWRETGFSGPKADCLAHIDAVWTDMRPASLRAFLASGPAGSPRP
ncbi:Protein MbtH [Methylobacterium crusticola]|uniref:Protein MbtH n=1 Tax=Methylobacterium crusticola TaxID=1697972 RepID=A0ABQ4R1M8_9HYPH|nr:MbtH family NRPS accessory protein [Methylobacterium crusticola]GJD51508.1 Protein MbtH [Methylobacterium crusticola]